MSWPLRLHENGAIFHALARGNGGQAIFFDEHDFEDFLRILLQARLRFAWEIYAFCLLANHFHILVRVADTPLSVAMQWIMTCYAKHFNSRRDRHGHVFQGRFKSIRCTDDSYFLELLRYIHLNPVRARQAVGPSSWPWTGHRELCGAERQRAIDARFPLSLFHECPATAMKLYSQFVDDGLANGCTKPAIAEWTAAPSRLLPIEQRRAVCKSSLAEIAQSVAKEAGLQAETLLGESRVRPIVHAKRTLIHRAVSSGHRPSAIASFLNCSRATVSKSLRPSESGKYGNV